MRNIVNVDIVGLMQSFGSCRNPKLCGLRHIILDKLDRPLLVRNGTVRVRISAVHSTTNYYARILKYKSEDGNIVDMSARHSIVEEGIKKHFSGGARAVNGVVQ